MEAVLQASEKNGAVSVRCMSYASDHESAAGNRKNTLLVLAVAHLRLCSLSQIESRSLAAQEVRQKPRQLSQVLGYAQNRKDSHMGQAILQMI